MGYDGQMLIYSFLFGVMPCILLFHAVDILLRYGAGVMMSLIFLAFRFPWEVPRGEGMKQGTDSFVEV